MPTVAELQVVIEAQDRASGVLRVLGADLRRVEDRAEQAGGAFSRLRGAVSGLGQLGLAAGGIGAIVDGFQRVTGALGGVVQQASDLNEQTSRAGVVFGDYATVVTDFAKTTAQSLGISRTEALEAAGSFGTLFRTAGLGADAAADMSTNLVTLAADLASFNNIDPAEALEKLRSGLVGESEPLRTVGVLLNETEVGLEGVRLGLAANANQLTEAQKIQARYSLIMRQTANQQGDFARTSTGLANAQRILRASWADITTTLGQAVLPTVARVASFLAQQMPAALQAVQRAVEALGPVLAAVFSGDLQGALNQLAPLVAGVAAHLGPALASWSAAFLTWVQAVTPPLLEALGALGERVLAWVGVQAPVFFRALIDEWLPAFLGWVSQVAPPLLEQLAALAGGIWQWIRQQAPRFLETLVGEWVPAFVRWVAQVVPPLYAELDRLMARFSDWLRDVGIPQMLGFGADLANALLRGLRTALGIQEGSDPIADLLRRTLIPAGMPTAGGAFNPGAALPAVGGPGSLPRVNPGAGGGPAPVTVDVGGVEVTAGGDPAAVADQAGEAVRQEVLAALTTSQAATDPGAGAGQTGAGR